MPQYIRRFAGLGSWILAAAISMVSAVAADETSSRYAAAEKPSPDGIGKVYMGREIAHVMGHEGADWLERPERVTEERPDEVVALLGLKPGDRVADIGAGTGYFSRRLAKRVLPGGIVFAEDIQPEMLDLLAKNLRNEGIANVQGVLGTITDPRLAANSLDLVIMVDVYHEFDHPFEMLAAITVALKPGGRVVFVEYKGEDPTVPIKRLHKMTEAQVRKEAEVQPLEWVSTIDSLPRQHVIIFRRKALAAAEPNNGSAAPRK
jgi:SAM-dependent methyltransferase